MRGRHNHRPRARITGKTGWASTRFTQYGISMNIEYSFLYFQFVFKFKDFVRKNYIRRMVCEITRYDKIPGKMEWLNDEREERWSLIKNAFFSSGLHFKTHQYRSRRLLWSPRYTRSWTSPRYCCTRRSLHSCWLQGRHTRRCLQCGQQIWLYITRATKNIRLKESARRRGLHWEQTRDISMNASRIKANPHQYRSRRLPRSPRYTHSWTSPRYCCTRRSLHSCWLQGPHTRRCLQLVKVRVALMEL